MQLVRLHLQVAQVSFVGSWLLEKCLFLQESTAPEVGFTDRERLLGDSALALVKSNAKHLGYERRMRLKFTGGSASCFFFVFSSDTPRGQRLLVFGSFPDGLG